MTQTDLTELALQACIHYPLFVQHALDMDDEYLVEFFNEVNDEANKQDKEFHKEFKKQFEQNFKKALQYEKKNI
jgi:hypothetical protein